MRSSGNIHVEREGDRVVVRSQWGNSLVGSICLGLLYIAGVIVIYLLNGEITDNLPSPVVTAGLILVGVYIMLPRRVIATFDSQERRSIRVYNFSFGLVTHGRVIAFDEIVALAIRNYSGDAWSPIIMRKSARPVTLTIEGGSRDDAIEAVETISSATGIAVDRAGLRSQRCVAQPNSAVQEVEAGRPRRLRPRVFVLRARRVRHRTSRCRCRARAGLPNWRNCSQRSNLAAGTKSVL